MRDFPLYNHTICSDQDTTYQVKDYARYELGGFSEEAKRQYRDANWENDLQKAYDAGKRMAESIL